MSRERGRLRVRVLKNHGHDALDLAVAREDVLRELAPCIEAVVGERNFAVEPRLPHEPEDQAELLECFALWEIVMELRPDTDDGVLLGADIHAWVRACKRIKALSASLGRPVWATFRFEPYQPLDFNAPCASLHILVDQERLESATFEEFILLTCGWGLYDLRTWLARMLNFGALFFREDPALGDEPHVTPEDVEP